MLKPQSNVFEIIQSLPSIFGTKVEPHWVLLFNPFLDQWSAMDYDKPDDLIEVALNDNWNAICLLAPADVAYALKLKRPDILCSLLRGYALKESNPATDFPLNAFFQTVRDNTPDPGADNGNKR